MASERPVFECSVTREIFSPCWSAGSKLPSSRHLRWTVGQQRFNCYGCGGGVWVFAPKAIFEQQLKHHFPSSKAAVFRREGSSWTLLPTKIVRQKKPQEVTMQLAISSGLPSAIEIHILEESLETMRVGELGQRLRTRNFVWRLRGLILKPKNVATISYSLSSHSCDRVDLRRRKKKQKQGSSISFLSYC